MPAPQISETTILQYASAGVLRYGRACYQQGAVLAPVLYGTRLLAEVKADPDASAPEFICCLFQPDGSITATCTCQNVWGSWCKHLVAACLVLLHQPEKVEEHPALETLLEQYQREDLQALVLQLAGQIPHLAEAIERTHAARQPNLSPSTTPSTTPAQIPQTSVNTRAIRREVRSAIHSLDRMRASEAYWYVGSVVGEVEQIANKAIELLEAGEGRAALTTLEAVTEEYMEEYENLDDSDGEVGDSFNQLGKLWAEVLLSTELSREEREGWAEQLTSWQDDLEDYGIDDAFDIATTAALQGWDDPALQRVLHGQVTEKGAWDTETPYYAADLALIRLAILERQERFQEYLYLAEAEGQTTEYLTMLVRLNRAQEAFAYGLQYLATPEEALSLARALCEHGERERSLQIAEHGLTLDGRKVELATWLRDQAEAMGKRELALRAAEQAFRAQISLENYRHVARLAGEQWPTHQPALLDYARTSQSYETQGKVDVFLSEMLIDDAIAALGTYASHTIVEQVVNVAVNSRPEWAIQACKKQAEPIMDGGKAQYYHAAASWLSKAHRAYQMLNRDNDWQIYVNELLQLHGRKYKLVPLLKAIK